jgi:hypothetical protein
MPAEMSSSANKKSADNVLILSFTAFFVMQGNHHSMPGAVPRPGGWRVQRGFWKAVGSPSHSSVHLRVRHAP